MFTKLSLYSRKSQVALVSLALALLTFSCSKNSDTMSPSQNPQVFDINQDSGPNLTTQGFPGLEEDPPEPVDTVYIYSDPQATSIIDSIAATDNMQVEFEWYASQGYEYAPEHSFILEGYDQGYSLTSKVFAMRYLPDTLAQALYIKSTTFFKADSVVSWTFGAEEFSFVDPQDTTYVLLDDVIWFRWHNPVSIAPLDWSWGTWGRCFRNLTIAGCAGASYVCAISGPGYGCCLAKGCAGSSVVSMVWCALDQLW